MRLLIGLGLLGLAAGEALAQASITFITAGRAEAVSPDGNWVVGRNGNGEAFRWDPVTGAQSLFGNAAVGVSADGQMVFGDGGTTPAQPAIWSGGFWTDLGGLLGSSGCPDLGTAYAFSDDGTTGTGLIWDNCNAHAFRWTAGATVPYTVLPQNGPFSARGNAISGNGSIIGGWDESSNGTRRAVIWLPNGAQRFVLANTPGNQVGAGEVWGLNTSGTIAVGQSNVGAFRWTAAGGAVQLGDPLGTNSPAAAMGVSDDGTIIVGTAGTFISGLSAFIWTEAQGMMLLDDYVTNVLGLTLPPNVSLQGATDITPDGRTIVGYGGTSPFFTDAFVLRLPFPCGWSTYGDNEPAPNVLDLSGAGSVNLGGVFQAVTTGLTSSVCVTATSFAPADFPAFGGTGLLDLFLFYDYTVNLAVGGTATRNVPLPATPTLAGAQLYFQSFALDGSQTEGWGLSNGMLLTLCP